MQHNTLASNYIIAAMAEQNKGNYEEAIALSEKALKLDPKEINGYWVRGLSYLKQPNYYQAIDDLEILLKSNVDMAMLEKVLAKVLSQLTITASKSDSIKLAERLNHKALIFFKNKKLKAANIMLALALTFHPNAKSYLDLARIKNDLQFHSGALRLCKAALKFDATNDVAFQEMAYAHAKLGKHHQSYNRLGEALYHYVKSLEKDPNNKDITNQLEKILAEKSKQEIFSLIQQASKKKAVKLLKQALDTNTLLGTKFHDTGFVFFQLSAKPSMVRQVRQYLQFLTAEETQIKTASRLIAQGKRDPQSAFFILPDEVNLQIAAAVNDTVPPEKVKKLVENNYGIPQVRAKRS